MDARQGDQTNPAHRQLGETPALSPARQAQGKGAAEVRVTRGGELGSRTCSVCHSARCAPSSSQTTPQEFLWLLIGNLLCIPNPQAVAELLAPGSARRVKVRSVLIDTQPFIVFSLCNHCISSCSGVHTHFLGWKQLSKETVPISSLYL